MSNKTICLIALLLLVAFAADASAGFYWKDYHANHMWSDPNNWDKDPGDKTDLPTVDADVKIQWDPNMYCIIDANMVGQNSAGAAELKLSGPYAEPNYAIDRAAVLEINGGYLEISNKMFIGMWGEADGSWYETGILRINSGQVNITGTSNLACGYAGEGIIEMNGGQLNINSVLWFPYYDNAPSKAHCYLYGGTITCLWFEQVEPLETTAEMDIRNDGTLIVQGVDETGLIQSYVDEGWLTAYGGRGQVVIEYDGADTIVTAAGDLGNAWNPNPADGAGEVQLDATLSWTPGDYADSHIVYFSTDKTAVDNGSAPSTATDVNSFDPGGLELGSVYYWRVDEVNETHPNSPWAGFTWKFTAKGLAWNPIPADGATGVLPSVLLGWTGSVDADKHTVYFGDSLSDVNETATPVSVEQDANTYDPDLNFSTTYYWRIDEVNLSLPMTWTGNIWTFTTSEHLVVDNFNSYADSYALWYVWDDFVINDSRAQIFIETDLAYDGNSIRLVYNNMYTIPGNVYGSWVDADTVDLQVGSDWAVGSAKALRLAFYGDPGNSTTVNDKMYIALHDGVTVESAYYPDVNDIKKAEWHQWQIDLEEEFSTTINLANVSRISIGFGTYGGGSSAGGTGTVYFDEIELWPPYCRSELVPTDITGDCATDQWDLDVLAGDWLEYDYTISTSAPDNGQMLAWYKLDGDASDSSGNGADADPNGDPAYVEGIDVNAVELDGGDDFLCTPDSNDVLQVTGDLTMALWLKASANQNEWAGILVKTNPTGSTNHWGMQFNDWQDRGITTFIVQDAWNWGVLLSDIADTWHHLALVYDATAETMTSYLDGAVIESSSWPYPPLTGEGHLNIGAERYGATGVKYEGLLDDIRIYSYPLSQAEIGGVMGESEIYQPVFSLANLYDSEPANSKAVNFDDYAIMADGWLDFQLWP